jgi:hypothetical protein
VAQENLPQQFSQFVESQAVGFGIVARCRHLKLQDHDREMEALQNE